jgi:hypothetical protein
MLSNLKYVSIFRKGDLSDESYNSSNDLRCVLDDVVGICIWPAHPNTDFDHQANFSR